MTDLRACPSTTAAPDERASAPENAYAKANDADVKRAAAEQRRAERRKQWAERRRHEMREPRAARDRTDWDDVARNVREDSDSRDRASGPRGFPQVKLNVMREIIPLRLVREQTHEKKRPDG